jgi:hypothetical protein
MISPRRSSTRSRSDIDDIKKKKERKKEKARAYGMELNPTLIPAFIHLIGLEAQDGRYATCEQPAGEETGKRGLTFDQVSEERRKRKSWVE